MRDDNAAAKSLVVDGVMRESASVEESFDVAESVDMAELSVLCFRDV